MIWTPFFWMNMLFISSEILHMLTIDMTDNEVKRAPFSLDLEIMEDKGSIKSLNSEPMSSI